MKHVDLFAGIGGATLAVDAIWPKTEHIFVEIDPYCQALLKLRFPNSQIYGDIRTFTNPKSGKSGKQTEQEGWEDFERRSWERNWLEVATRLCRMDDGLPRRMDRNPRLKALGNAIVPQVAEEIFKAIKRVDL